MIESGIPAAAVEAAGHRNALPACGLSGQMSESDRLGAPASVTPQSFQGNGIARREAIG